MLRILTILLLVNLQTLAQSALQQQVITLSRMIQKSHYAPVPVNDALSERIFEQVIKELDEEKVFFTKPEYDKIAGFRQKLDEELTGKSWGFTELLSSLLKSALKRADSILTITSKQPVNFDQPDFLPIKASAGFAENTAALKLRWTQYFKSEIIEHIYDQHHHKSVGLTKATVAKEEPAVRALVAGMYKKDFNSLLSGPASIADYISETYLKSIATAQDPHTEYFPAEEKQAFNASLSSENLRFGFALKEEDNGDFRFASIVPGSPAWYSGDIHVNDKLISVKTPDGNIIATKNTPYAIIDSAFDNASQSVELGVQSADGKLTLVTLHKEMVSNDENFVKGYVIIQAGRKTGYISLPSFYTNWDENTGSSCANDVAKEIVKLKKEGIESLILDLRYNGGGSVGEAIELSGIFIDAGPLALIRESDGKTVTLKDPARGTIYDGPLAVMINGQSASASELVAATLQDYNRAVIIGSNSFGKATMQSVFPIDTTLDVNNMRPDKNLNEKNGFLKVTIGKIYRITGKTNQLTGVSPDIILPDLIASSDYTERSLAYAMPSDTVIKKVFYTPLKQMPLPILSEKSAQRQHASVYFKQLEKTIQMQQDVTAKNVIPLQWESYQHWRQQQDEGINASTGMLTSTLKVAPATFDNKLMELNAFEKEQNAKLVKAISEDPYIEEAVNIMMDAKSIYQ